MDFIPFSRIIGQEKAIQFLKRAMAQEKLPHAYLFVGIPGVGKTSTAVALAQGINCAQSKNGEGCGKCISCRQFVSGNFPDLRIVEPEGQFIKIEQVREIDRSMGFKPVSGRYRVVIVRRAEMMTPEAANAFLKTLEEPPPGNILILNVTEPRDLLPTIVSRCQKVGFRPIPASLVAQGMVEKANLDYEKALLLARIAEGSLGRALAMAEKGFLEKRQEYISSLLSLRSISDTEALEMALRFTGKEKKKEHDEKGEEGGKIEKEDIPLLFGVWKSCYRDMALIRSEGPEDEIINRDLCLELKKAAQGLKINHLVSSLLLIDQGESDFLHSRNTDLMMENLILDLRRLMGEAGREGALRET
jgi:DNA polymerase-3 subunit delta'